MGVYLLRRLLLFLPTLLVVSVVIFFLSRLSPGDPIIQFIGDPFEEVGRGGVGLDRAELEYAAGAQRLGLDKPLFYLQLTGAAFPDTLYRILRMDHRKNLRNLIGQYGNWPQIEIYYKRLREASAICYSMEEQKKDWLINIRANIQQLFVNHQDVRISYLLNEIDTLRQEALTTDSTGLLPKSPLFSSLEEVKGTYARMLDGATPWKRYLPRLYWHGMNNQYHQWFLGILQGDWGVSMKDRQPVLRKIGQAAFWTLLINIPALLIAFGVAIPLGIWMARKDRHSSSGWVSLLLFFLYSLPNFWIATLLILFLTTPEYGEWLNIFPTVGLSSLPDSAPFWSRFWIPELILFFRSFVWFIHHWLL
jgi:peptide/nickel transport system permease protein